jgi:hypothetical protein
VGFRDELVEIRLILLGLLVSVVVVVDVVVAGILRGAKPIR